MAGTFNLNSIMDFTQIKTQLVELVIPSGSNLVNFTFDFQQFLQQKNIISIEVLTFADCPVSPLGNTVLTYAQISGAFMTLYGANPEDISSKGIWLSEIPLPTLHRINNLADPYVYDLFTLMPRTIVWEKSKIITPGGAIAPDTQSSFLFQVGYSGNAGD